MTLLLPVMRLLLLLIPVIAASRFPQRRSAPIASLPSYDSEDYEVIEDEDFEAATEFPDFTYQTTRSFHEESSDGTIEGILKDTMTIIEVADGPVERAEEVGPLDQTLSELFYENHPVEKYDFEVCEARLRKGVTMQHYTYLQHNFYLSSLDPVNRNVGRFKPKAFTWPEAHDLCRSQCKELLTLDSFDKAYFVSSIIKSDGLLGIWTSGRRCDFPGCRDREDVEEDGWFWSTSGQEIHTSNNQRSLGQQPYEWSKTGRAGPQPDNAEFVDRGVNESCLALRYEVKKKGLKLNDMPCHFKLNVVCEEPRELSEL